MAYFADLGTESQIAEGPFVRAVGWLSTGYAFPTGSPSDDLVARLELFRQNWNHCIKALSWAVAGGAHTCEFCLRYGDSANFGVPAGDVLYVCPGMITHYVHAHEYDPPREFVAALLLSPVPGTLEYDLATARFSRTLGTKDSALQVLVCRLRAMLGRDRFITYGGTPDDSRGIWLGDYNVKHLQARVLIRVLEDPDCFAVALGHGPFHEREVFTLSREYASLSMEALGTLIGAEFTPSERRR